MFALGAHYCIQLLPEVFFFSNIPFTFSFAKVVFLLWYFSGITIGFLWDSYGNDVSMIYLEDFYGISEDAMGNSMVLLLDS